MTKPNNNRTVMRQRWSDLLFIHWSIDIDVLQQLIPTDLEIDTYDAQAYVGLVPFRMSNISPPGYPPIQAVSDFYECNVRTYVKYQDVNPGVWFFSLDASNALAVAVARKVFHLPYYHAVMEQVEARICDELGKWSRRVSYKSERLHPGSKPVGCNLRYEPYGSISESTPGSLEEFLVERYTLYSVHKNMLYRGQVTHQPYQIQPAKLLRLNESLLESAGISRHDFSPHVVYSRNVVVEIAPLELVKRVSLGKIIPSAVAGLNG